MAETSGPFDPVDPENPVAPGEILAEADWESMLQHVIDGIPDLPTSTQLKPAVSGSTARGIDLAAGLMLVRGHWYRSSAPLTVTSTANSSGAPRIDRVVARLNRTSNTVTATLLTGTAGSGQPPALTDSASITDRPIARWTIETGATTATGLVDERRFLAPQVLLFTSATRPIEVKTGQLGYETDTGRVVLFNGSTWVVVFDDTGWVTLPLNGKDAAAWSDTAPYNPLTYRRVNGVVYLRFSLKRITFGLGLTDEDGSTPYVLPVGCRPASDSPPVLGHGNHARNALQLFVYSSGEIRVYPLNSDLTVNRRIYAQAQFPVG
ncbi:hypothetical protein [Actinomadura luteofluorescens]|uniref:hypothetical protein n=1 Tax=Actinomadura luteofluorescens TaxID=46163 RepID=UPI003D8DE19B